MPFTPEQKREHRKVLFKQGLCTRCREPVPKGWISCSDCRLRTKIKFDAIHKERKEKGLCIVCGGIRDDPTKLKCASCAEDALHYERMRL